MRPVVVRAHDVVEPLSYAFGHAKLSKDLGSNSIAVVDERT